MFPFKLVDLSHTIDPTIPLWPGSDPFCMKIRFDYDHGNGRSGSRSVAYSMVAGTGTHMDAPAHFIKGGKTLNQFSLQELVVPVCIMSVQHQVNDDSDYTLQPVDIQNWEKQHGKIPAGCVVIMNTGWAQRWPDLQYFLNEDADGIKHFPGFSVEACHILLKRNIVGIGIDTFSLDPGNTKDFGVHYLMLGKGLYFIECLANLDQLPPVGAFIGSFPIKVAQAPEMPARIIGLIPADR